VRTEGIHLLLEYWGCDAVVLNDLADVKGLMQRAARATGATIVETVCRPFRPQGVSVMVVIEESHLSIHTWPETGYAAVDLFTCGTRCKPEKAHDVLVKGLKAKRFTPMKIRRGLPGPPFLEAVPVDLAKE
jgi:S-adenosylmethionine decarboxylase